MTKSTCEDILKHNLFVRKGQVLFFMNWLNKLERKFGRFAIPNLMLWVVGAYAVGFVLYMVNPAIMNMLTLSPHEVLRGQVWRIVTWILMPSSMSVFSLLIMALLYYQLGMALERAWGVFRFNVYIFSGLLFTVIGAFILYGIIYALGGPIAAAGASSAIARSISTKYINMSIFLAFALMYPNMQLMLYFVIPIKMKWMAAVYAALTVYEFIVSGWGGRVSIFMSLLNFIIFFLSTRDFKRYSPQEVHRRQKFQAQMRQSRPRAGVTKHKCAICGRTEQDDPTLEFRFCSKCEGNYEYCQDHLFTHQHIRRS